MRRASNERASVRHDEAQPAVVGRAREPRFLARSSFAPSRLALLCFTLALLLVPPPVTTTAADSPTAFDPVESAPNWQPPARIDFIRDVVPALTKSGCNAGACHGSFQGRGGLQLSLLGFDPAWDYEVLAKSARGRRVSPAAPENSLLLAKPTGRVPHQGGVRFETDSPAYLILRQWIAEGLPAPSDAGLAGITGIKLRVEPPSLRLAPGATQ
ncbi:MAG TPA: hypothetical protein PLV92_19325, partial [Pirellulaceae bacterium]|nr:hypothetical protein [Pirellulaceae bacterium]